jgi:uncharacterized protein (TIGR03790 family)
MGAESRWTGKRFATRVHSIGLLVALLAPGSSLADDPPEAAHPEVLVVVNDASPTSVAIGEAYRRSRGVPAGNVVHLTVPLRDPTLATADHETIGRAQYEERVRDPIASRLRDRGLAERIEILVTTKGVPLRIAGRPGANPFDEDAAAVDAELAVLLTPFEGSAGMTSARNPYFGSPLRFSEWRRRHPDEPLRYLVARLTGYADANDP